MSQIQSAAEAAAAALTLLASDTTTDVDVGLRVVDAGSTKTIEVTNQYRGTVQTTNATPANVITIPLGATPGVLIAEAQIVCFNTTDSLGAGYHVFGSIRTDGTDSTLCGTPDSFINEETGMSSCDANFVAGGVGDNNMYLEVTGIAAKTIEWKAILKYQFVS